LRVGLGLDMIVINWRFVNKQVNLKFLDTKSVMWGKAMSVPYENPILLRWSAEGYPRNLLDSLSDNPPLLDVPVTDMEVLQAWVAADHILNNGLLKGSIKASLTKQERPKQLPLWQRVLTQIALGVVLIFLTLYLARRDFDPMLFVIYLIASMASGFDSMKAYARIRWGVRFTHSVAIFILIILGAVIGFLLPTDGKLFSGWRLLGVWEKMLLIWLIWLGIFAFGFWVHELWLLLALNLIHKKRSGSLK
jgi:hypothetical protein